MIILTSSLEVVTSSLEFVTSFACYWCIMIIYIYHPINENYFEKHEARDNRDLIC